MKIRTGIIKLREKHDEYLLDGSTVQKVKDICVDIVKKRHKANYWYNDITSITKPVEPERPVGKQPKYITDAYVSEYNNFIRENRDYEALYEQKELLDKALSGDGEAAYRFLDWRSDYEYEYFEITQFDKKYNG